MDELMSLTRLLVLSSPSHIMLHEHLGYVYIHVNDIFEHIHSWDGSVATRKIMKVEGVHFWMCPALEQ